MPPLRSMPPAKPIKTERTHEENQERAYIAASRRSDRSLEARVESARRASEIHKRRTGRSLRVTEQDVVNEEMYEEEDDDLPMQYRRLTAHLQTSNADFDRRLQAYLTNHVAMRAGLMGNGPIDPFPNTQLQGGQFMNPGMMQIPQNAFANPMLPPTMMARGMNYRQSPYPMHGIRPNLHVRSASIANPQDLSSWQQQQQPSFMPSAQASPVETMKMEDRRMSMPAQAAMPPHTPNSQDGQVESAAHGSPAVSRTSSSHNLAAPQNGFQPARSPRQQPTPPMQSQPQPARHASFAGPFHTPAMHHDLSHNHNSMTPLTATLPMESQQLLAGNPAFDQGDPFGLMMGQTHSAPKTQQPFYSYNPNGGKQKQSQSPPAAITYAGMNQTLAPASNMPTALDTSLYTFDSMTSPGSAFTPYPPAGFGAGFDPTFGMDPLKMTSSGSTSAQLTPSADAEWTTFLDGGMFDEAAPA